MLVIRKDLKVGLGIAAAVVGVAVIYGGMSLLTSRSTEDHVTFSPGDSQNPELPTFNLDDAVAGLPPREEPAATKTPQSNNDIFSESVRSDGSANIDKWATAWSTGRVSASVRNETSALNPVPTGADLSTPATASASPGATDPVIRTVTPTATPANSTPASSSTALGKYTIAPGDTFSSIAAKLYGNRSLYHVIENANPGVDPRKLKVGQQINVPDRQAVTNIADSVRTTATRITGAIDTTRQYRVQPGDTLHQISQKLYGKTKYWAAIYDLNKPAIGPDAGRIKVGMVLDLPQIPTAD